MLTYLTARPIDVSGPDLDRLPATSLRCLLEDLRQEAAAGPNCSYPQWGQWEQGTVHRRPRDTAERR